MEVVTYVKTKQIIFTKPYVAELLDAECLPPKEYEVSVSNLIVYGSQVFQLDLVMANVFILGILATFMYLFIVWIESILFKNYNE